MDGTTVEELTTEEEMAEGYHVLQQLRPDDEATFVDLVGRMKAERKYRLFAQRTDEGEIRGIAGLFIQTNLYHGRYAWLTELVVDESHRGEGYGGQLLSWLESWAEEQGCSCIELPSGLWRDDAHRFYEREGMEEYCLTFKKELSTGSLS